DGRASRFGGPGHGTIGTWMPNRSSSASCNGSAYSGDDGGSGDPSGSGTAASEPSMSAGHGGTTARASHRMRRAAKARAWFRSMIAGQPPGYVSPSRRMDSATHRTGVGSTGPNQSNSSPKRERARPG